MKSFFCGVGIALGTLLLGLAVLYPEVTPRDTAFWAMLAGGCIFTVSLWLLVRKYRGGAELYGMATALLLSGLLLIPGWIPLAGLSRVLVVVILLIVSAFGIVLGRINDRWRRRRERRRRHKEHHQEAIAEYGGF